MNQSMKKFTSVNDVTGVKALIKEGLHFKKEPHGSDVGANKTLGLIFFNPSLRTRMSVQKAAYNLGMNVISMNVREDGWKLSFEDGTVMDGDSQEHIKDAVKVMSQYVDVLGVRTFASMTNRDDDYQEKILNKFIEYSDVPIISLESATLHPLQSLADVMTIEELNLEGPKVVVTWAPHPKVLPQAVANSFLEWSAKIDADITLACQPGYELPTTFTEHVKVVHNQLEALEGADIVYAKNWSSYRDYGKVPEVSASWMIDQEKMALTNNGYFMHCLPVRRNVVVHDKVLDDSLVYRQAGNRIYAAQAVLKRILKSK